MTLDLIQLRKTIRRSRRQISSFEQRQSEQLVINRLSRHCTFKKSKHIGLYLHAFGEVSTHKIIQHCFQTGKRVYLPVVSTLNNALSWVPISKSQYNNCRFTPHNLGMLEPRASRGLHVTKLDLLIMPLIACDPSGTRIGMGGGFYDRTLATAPHQPYRLGLAHELQFIQQKLPREKWDQPLDALLTPNHLRRFKR